MGEIREWTAEDARSCIALPGLDDDKYSRGVLGLVTGSALYPGAAVLGVEAAWRTGVGMVRYMGPAAVTDRVLTRRPETVAGFGRVNAWLVGSGTSAQQRTDEAEASLLRALGGGAPVVIDAGALDQAGHHAAPAIVTPHARELARMLADRGIAHVDEQEVHREQPKWATIVARELNVTVLLKGSRTIVADASGGVSAISHASPWLATAGTGDVLGGILGALCATNDERVVYGEATLADLGATAAWIHAETARRLATSGPFTALDLAEAIRATIADLCTPEAHS